MASLKRAKSEHYSSFSLRTREVEENRLLELGDGSPLGPGLTIFAIKSEVRGALQNIKQHGVETEGFRLLAIPPTATQKKYLELTVFVPPYVLPASASANAMWLRASVDGALARGELMTVHGLPHPSEQTDLGERRPFISFHFPGVYAATDMMLVEVTWPPGFVRGSA